MTSERLSDMDNRFTFREFKLRVLKIQNALAESLALFDIFDGGRTFISSKKSSAVSCASMPSLSRIRPRRKPSRSSVSTTKSDLACFPSPPVSATMIMRFAVPPFVMKVLEPLITQPLPSFLALVLTFCKIDGGHNGVLR